MILKGNEDLPEDLDKVNREFFVFSADQGLAYEKITCSGTYHSIRDEMVADVNDAAAFWEAQME